MKIKFVHLAMLLLVLGLSLAQENKFYEFTVTDDKNYTPIALKPGQPPVSVHPPTGYRAELIAFNGTALYVTYFGFVEELHAEDFDFETGKITSRTIAINVTNVTVSIPYFPNGKQINVYDPENKQILEIPVAHFADVCGDKICQPHESYESCPKDCPSGSRDDYCDSVKDNICDTDCTAKQDTDCSPPADSSRYIAGAVTAAGLIVIIFVLYYRKKNSEKSVERILKKLR